MINPAQIPDEAVEAAAISLMSKLMIDQHTALYVWNGMYDSEKDRFRAEARAAIAAALSAWSGAFGADRTDEGGIEYDANGIAPQCLVLPLPEGDA